MPLYEYECEECTQRFERIQKFSDPPIETCPSCGGRVKKLPSSPAIQFKGSGWYITDYAKKPAADTSKPAAAKDGGGDAGGGDAGAGDASKKDAPKKDTATTPSKTD